ncbi:Tetratricopeptide repeat protein [Seminavis robusta]|uniref:Tetratricopeptide repeat protein n=1 Tax=Seminavis robusta TaxID=568900 RepID=A0A9N8ETC5_9STRA|nr:Tetratricopeptide repeat protein [Seminavis robusta]|eukprot:Sro1817_g299540.1 Tetratricopeptide repeat protein (216) ;mRNA; r:16182-16829
MGDYEGALSKHKNLAIDCQYMARIIHQWQPSTTTLGSSWARSVTMKALWQSTRKLLPFDCQHWAKNHPSVATTYNNIALVLNESGDYEGALAKYEEALAIQLSALGKNHPDLAATYNNIGCVLQKMGDYEGALTNHMEALGSRLSVMGKNHPDTAQSYHNIGCVLYSMGDHSGALLKFEECLAIWEPVLGADHPNTKTCMESFELVKTGIASCGA